MNQGEEEPAGAGALEQVNEARSLATEMVSEVRQRGQPNHHPNLAPAGGDEPAPATVATQAVADYLLQLRPYRATSDSWDVDLGGIQLPEKIYRGEAPGRTSKSQTPIWCCRELHVPISDVSELIRAANMNVLYSTAKPSSYGEEIGTEQEYTPADSSASGRNGSVRTYKLVFSPQTLLRFVEIADEIAAQMNLLIEIETPATQDRGGF